MAHVLTLHFLPVEGINNQTHRSMELQATDADLDILSDIVNVKGNAITAADLGSTATGIATVSAMPDFTVNIANGWHERRYSFLLIVDSWDETDTATKFTTYITGWTNFADATLSGIVDPEMVLHMNSVINVISGEFNGVPYSKQHSAYNLLYDPDTGGNALFDENGKKIIRPQDILVGVNAQMLSEFDTPSYSVTDRYNETGSVSKSANSTVLDITTQTLVATINGKQMADDMEEALVNSVSHTTEHSMMAIPFFAELMREIKSSVPTTFPLKVLERLDPNFTSNSYGVFNTKLDVFDSENMAANSVELSVATSLMQEISKIMLDNMLSTITVNFNNFNNVFVNVIADSMIPGVDLFTLNNRINSELRLSLPALLTQGNRMIVNIDVTAYLSGMCSGTVELNGSGIRIPFTFPTFANSLLSSNITNAQNNQSIIADMATIVNSI